MLAALLVSVTLLRWPVFTGSELAVFARNSLVISALATGAWVAVTLATRPEPQEVLLNFYRQVRPDVTGWGPVARLASDVPATRDLAANLRAWVLGCALVYSALFAVGDFCLQRPEQGIVLAGVAVASALLLGREIRR